MHVEKNRTYARTFPVQLKEINVVKVRITIIMYSSRKLKNKKPLPQLATFEDKLLVLSTFMAAQTTIISAPS